MCDKRTICVFPIYEHNDEVNTLYYVNNSTFLLWWLRLEINIGYIKKIITFDPRYQQHHLRLTAKGSDKEYNTYKRTQPYSFLFSLLHITILRLWVSYSRSAGGKVTYMRQKSVFFWCLHLICFQCPYIDNIPDRLQLCLLSYIAIQTMLQELKQHYISEWK